MDILGTNVDAKEVHARFLLFSEPVQFGALWKGRGAVTIPPGPWSGIHWDPGVLRLISAQCYR